MGATTCAPSRRLPGARRLAFVSDRWNLCLADGRPWQFLQVEISLIGRTSLNFALMLPCLRAIQSNHMRSLLPDGIPDGGCGRHFAMRDSAATFPRLVRRGTLHRLDVGDQASRYHARRGTAIPRREVGARTSTRLEQGGTAIEAFSAACIRLVSCLASIFKRELFAGSQRRRLSIVAASSRWVVVDRDPLSS